MESTKTASLRGVQSLAKDSRRASSSRVRSGNRLLAAQPATKVQLGPLPSALGHAYHRPHASDPTQ